MKSIHFSSCFFCDTVEAEKKQGEMCMNQHFWKYIAGLLIFGSNGIVASHIDLTSYEIVYLRSGIGGVALVLFVGCLAFMGMHVLVDNAEVSLRRQKAELTEQLDMDYIRTEATERLGMSEPQSYQVVYIDVPKQSYTVQHNADDAAEGTSILTKVTDLWKKD